MNAACDQELLDRRARVLDARAAAAPDDDLRRYLDALKPDKGK